MFANRRQRLRSVFGFDEAIAEGREPATEQIDDASIVVDENLPVRT